MNPIQFLQIKGMWDEFTSRHPKLPNFLSAVSQHGIKEGTVIEVQVQTEDGTSIASNLKITKEDIELFQKMKEMN